MRKISSINFLPSTSFSGLRRYFAKKHFEKELGSGPKEYSWCIVPSRLTRSLVKIEAWVE